MDEQFDDIRPFNDDEIPAAVASLSKEEYFRKAIGFLPGDTETFMKEFSTVSTTDEFQTRMLFPFLKWIAATTSDSLRGVGFENLDPSKSYTYISNHRDILLDATLLGLLLAEHGIPTPETALGDNLLVYPWMSELVRVNKSIIVYRNMPMMKTLEEAHRLSGYINHALRDKNRSVWIAQREGRAKNSDDRTQERIPVEARQSRIQEIPKRRLEQYVHGTFGQKRKHPLHNIRLYKRRSGKTAVSSKARRIFHGGSRNNGQTNTPRILHVFGKLCSIRPSYRNRTICRKIHRSRKAEISGLSRRPALQNRQSAESRLQIFKDKDSGDVCKSAAQQNGSKRHAVTLR